MKTLGVLLALSVGTWGYLIKVPITPSLEIQPVLAPSGWIHLQKLVLSLFENVCEPSQDPLISKLSQEFSTSINAADFMEPEVITKFQTLKTGIGFLPKGQIFSEYNADHTNELNIVFEVMRNAKSFNTFYKVAAWARQNLNCGLYVSLIYLGLENRRDTEKLYLPPPYELLPNYFIRKDIIIQGSSLLAGEEFTPSEGVRDEGNAYTLDANYTANFYDNDDESKLAYFREDIGLNSFYFLRMLKLAPWINRNVDINSRYGEQMYHMIKQLVARYNLERYSNGMPEQDNLSWDSLSDAPYDPMLVYSNGNEFIHRTSSVQLPENEDKVLLQTIENNIATVVSHMREGGYNKTQILNHLMEILVTGEKSYDILARQLLGKVLINNGQPTIFEHYMTSLRDPLIWKLYKNIVDLMDKSLKMLPPYSKNELYFPGVEVMNVDVKKITTNFDYFEFDITEALKIGNGDTTFQVKIGQPRLSHKPFTMKLNISSLVNQRGLIKIYLGPKMIPGEFARKKNLFSLLDFFDYDLKKGSNVISRSSNDMKNFAPDFISLNTLQKKVENAEFGLDSLPLNMIESQISFPERLSIPRGIPEGLPLQLFVFVAPYMKVYTGGAYSTSSMEPNTAVLSPLYPLDLVMEDRVLLDLPNALVKDFIVTHKGISKVSNYGGDRVTKSWYENKPNGPPSRPNPYNNGNEPYDYSSKVSPFQQDNTGFNGNYQHFDNQDVNYYDIVQNDNFFTSSGQNLKGSYDYSPQKQQPTNSYKPARTQYQSSDYSSKRVDYKTLYKNKATEEPNMTKTDNSFTEKVLLNNDMVPHNVDNVLTNNLNNDVDQKLEADEQMQKDDSSINYNLFKTSNSDDSKENESFDYKALRPKIVKPEYKKIYKAARKAAQESIDVAAGEKILQKNFINKEKFNKEINDLKSLGKMEVFKIFKNTKNMESPKEIPSNQIYDKNNVIVEDIGDIDLFQMYKDKTNVDALKAIPPNKYDKVIIKDPKDVENTKIFGILKDGNDLAVRNVNGATFFKVFKNKVNINPSINTDYDKYETKYTKDAGSSEYIGVFKDYSGEEFYKVVPITQKPDNDIDSNTLYKYIMRVIHNNFDGDDTSSSGNVN